MSKNSSRESQTPREGTESESSKNGENEENSESTKEEGEEKSTKEDEEEDDDDEEKEFKIDLLIPAFVISSEFDRDEIEEKAKKKLGIEVEKLKIYKLTSFKKKSSSKDHLAVHMPKSSNQMLISQFYSSIKHILFHHKNNVQN